MRLWLATAPTMRSQRILSSRSRPHGCLASGRTRAGPTIRSRRGAGRPRRAFGRWSDLASIIACRTTTGLGPMESTRCLPKGVRLRGRKGTSGDALAHGGCRAIGIANVLLDRPDEAITALLEVLLLTAGRPELAWTRILSLGYLAFAAADTGGGRTLASGHERRGHSSTEHHLGGIVTAAPVFTAKAMVLAHDGDFERAKPELAAGRRLGISFAAHAG